MEWPVLIGKDITNSNKLPRDVLFISQPGLFSPQHKGLIRRRPSAGNKATQHAAHAIALPLKPTQL